MNVELAYTRCEEITRREAKNFSYGIRLLAPPERRAMSALYALARRIDDIGDGDLPAPDKLAALGRVRAELGAAATSSDDPVLAAVADAAARYPIPIDAFGELIDGCEMDVRGTSYETIDELVGYCRLVAGSVGRLSLGVFGSSDPAAATPRADALGVALQLTNILRDVVEDRGMGRVYLPADDARRLGCAPDLSGPPDALAALVGAECVQARAWFAEGRLLLPLLDRRSRACVATMAGIYERLLVRIERDPGAVTRGRVSLPVWEKAWVAAAGIAGARQGGGDAGAEVVVAERRGRLGGLTWSFQRRGLWLDNGQHVFLRCCTAYQALLERLGVADLVHLQDRLEIPVLAPGGTRARLWRSHLPAPLHLAPSLLGYAHLPIRQRLALGRAALSLRLLDPEDPALDAMTFGAWLARHGQTERAVEVLWDLITVPTVNLHARDASLALAAKVFRTGLLDRADAGDVGWSNVPLGRLHGEAAVRALDRAGVEVWTGARVTRVSAGAGGFEVVADGRTVTCDAVIVATPPEVAADLVPEGVLGPVAELGASPIVNVHLVFDRRVTDLPMAAAVDSPIQFVFDRSGSSGLTGPGQCLAVSLSAADAYLGWGAHALEAYVAAALGELFPLVERAEVVDAAVTREPRATFRGVPGTRTLRPSYQTTLPGLLVAGAWTATGWPATMEGAVRSGGAAALGAVGGPSRPDLEPVTVVRGGNP